MERILKNNETWEDAAKRLHRGNKILQDALGCHKGPESEPEIPYEKRKLMTLELAKLWTVRMKPAMVGPRRIAKKALEDSSIRPVDWESNGLILLPPMREDNMSAIPFDVIKRALEAGGTYRVEQCFTYGLRG